MDLSQLKSFVSRIVERENEKAETAEDIRSIYAEAKAVGFDPKALRAAVKISMEDAEKKAVRETRESVLAQYLDALGDLSTTPLGRAAIERATHAQA